MIITRYDKEEIVFYNNKEYELEVDEGECGRGVWNEGECVSVERCVE